MINHKTSLFATATSTGLTLSSFAELLHTVNWAQVLTVVGSAVATAICWYQSARQAKREQDRLDREEQRQQRWEDVLQELKLQRAAANPSVLAAAPAVKIAE